MNYMIFFKEKIVCEIERDFKEKKEEIENFHFDLICIFFCLRKAKLAEVQVDPLKSYSKQFFYSKL